MMRVPLARAVAVLSACAFVVGCATVPVEETFDEAREVARERTGQRVEWIGVSESAEVIDAAVSELLAEPLDADAAVQVALLSNRRLQARYAELGRATAEATQAGLPPNPFLEITARWRDGKPDGTPQLEILVVEEILSLFLLPARKRLAAVELERARLDLAGAVIDQVAEVRTAFYRYQAEMALLELDRTALSAVEAGAEMTLRLYQAGNVPELDLLVQREALERMRLEVADRELAAADARQRVTVALGLWGEQAGAWRAVGALPPVPETARVPADIEAVAVERSLDVAGAWLDLEAAARRLGITDVTAVLPELEVGAEAERESEEGGDSQWLAGPSVGFEVPIFDQGHARKVRASMEIRRQWDLLAALGVELRSAVHQAATRVEYAHRKAVHRRDVVGPLASAVTGQTQLHFNAMFVGIFQLLDARRREVEAARELILAQRDYHLARTALAQIEAGRMPSVEAGGMEQDARPMSAATEDH